jgi:hypothetical protein
MATPGAKNQPQFVGTDPTTITQYLNDVSNYAAKVGNVKVGNGSERNALTGSDLWDGLRFIDDQGYEKIYYASTGWTPFPVISPPDTGGMFTTVSGWTVVKQNWTVIGGYSVQFYITVQRTGGAITVPDNSGNIANVTVAWANEGFRPLVATPLPSGSEGRVASMVLNTDGQLRLVAVANPVNIATGEQFSAGGWFPTP